MPDEPSIQVTLSDLTSERVDEYVEAQRYLRREVGEIEQQSFITRIVYANWFYLALAGLGGALLGWGMIEPFFDDFVADDDPVQLAASLLIFPTVAAMVGLFLGGAEGAICRNGPRAVKNAAVGVGVGFLGGLILWIPASIVYGIFDVTARSMQPNLIPGEMPTGLAFLVLMMGRAAAWGLFAIPAGIGQGLAMREKKVIINGVIGGFLGGLLGGLFFDPISLVLTAADGQATYSRAVGFGVIGISVGVFIGLVQGWTKTAWLLMQKGPLAGKQFIIFRDTTTLGSSPKSDVYLFKDDAIEPTHAKIVNRGGRFELEDQSTPDGTYVNGIAVTRRVLQAGDQIVMGKTVLEFSLKEQKR